MDSDAVVARAPPTYVPLITVGTRPRALERKSSRRQIWLETLPTLTYRSSEVLVKLYALREALKYVSIYVAARDATCLRIH